MKHRGVLIRLILLGCISVLAFIGIGIYGIANTSSTFNKVQDVYRTAKDVRQSSETLTIPLNEVRQLTLSIVIAPNPTFQQQVNERQKAISAHLDETLNQMRLEIDDETERGAFDKLREEWEGYKRLKEVTVEKSFQRYREEAFINATGPARDQFQRVNNQVNVWMQTKIDAAEQVYQGANARYYSVLRISSIVIAALTLVVGGFGFYTARSIFQPIAVLKEAAARIARRETAATIAVHTHDELGDLARSMEAMAAAIQTHMTQQAAAEAEVRKLNVGLERRVEERTADLENAVAELRVAKEAAEAANAKLVEAERLKSEFFANVSHELRTPLTLILAPLESILAGEYGPISADSRQLLETMHNNAVRLLQMVTGLLDFAKLEAKRVEVKREPVEIVALTRAVLADFQPLMARSGLDSALEADPAEACISMDRYIYERILFNLLSNALKFTPQGGKISVVLGLDGGRLRLAVSDTGIGIAAEDVANLFQKFRQLEGAATRRFEGTGLGLALVKEFSGLLGGSVSVASTLGSGSTFSVECLAPIVEAPPQEGAPIRQKKSLLRQFDAGGRTPLETSGQEQESLPKLVIAEDNAELASYIVSLLRVMCQIRVAQDGEEALELVRQWNPDVVLSDVMMPKRDGLSLCRELKSVKETAAIPVVLLTALTHREALLKGWEAGANEYLFKPFHPRELATRIKAILAGVENRKRWEQELAAQAEELARSNAELEQFAYIASHDLQEPLRKVQAFGDLLVTSVGEKLNENERLYVDRMRDGARRMQGLINDLLAFARVTSQAKAFVEVDLARVAREVVSDLESRLQTTGGRVDIGDLPRLDCDSTQMHQLLQNLIGNALKFHRDGVPPEVVVRSQILRNSRPVRGSRSIEAMCELTIADNGIGFEEKYLDRIFAPFQRLHGQGKYEGTGIGLAICRKVVERHGGTLTARSTPGQGTTFIIHLPLRQPKGRPVP